MSLARAVFLIGPNPVDIIQQFHELTSEFIGENHRGILIFAFDAALFEAGEQGFNLLYNIGLLSTAITAFALFQGKYSHSQPIRKHRVDWSRWRTLSSRCCVVIRKPSVIDPISGELLKREKFDEFITRWRYEQDFARLDDLKGFVRFDSGHVIPRTYPPELGDPEALSGRDLYWDVLVRPARMNPKVWRFNISSLRSTERLPPQIRKARNEGVGVLLRRVLEEDFLYVIRSSSPGTRYDDAQRAIYMAAKGRLNLDNGERHLENINAAAALRQIGYEVLPISVMLSLFPRVLHLATAITANRRRLHLRDKTQFSRFII